MKIRVTKYTFDKTAKTVTFADYATINLESILLITNVTSNIIIYNFADSAKGGTVATNVLTLTYNTSAMANTDKLLIYYEDGIAENFSGPGFLKVSDEPHQLFYDPFDAAPDTTNVWTNTSAGGGVAPAVTTGVLSLGTGTTVNGYSKVISIATFKPVIPGWLIYSDAIQLPDGAAPLINSYRYWGAGSTPATPAVATPITDGYGFELNTDQKLRAVVYAGGTRTVIADLSSSGTNKQPLDANYHRYIIQVRTDRTFFYIDTFDAGGLVASTNFQSPQIQTLSKLYLAIANAGTAPVSNTQILSSGAVVSDTGKNETQISDGTFPWRKATVSAAGALSVTDNSGIATTATLTNVASSAANVTLLANNANRKSATIYNESTSAVYVKFGATASATSYTIQLAANSYYELPRPTYTGIIDGIWVTANGSARVTEL